jgi:hypothetical protein
MSGLESSAHPGARATLGGAMLLDRLLLRRGTDVRE